MSRKIINSVYSKFLPNYGVELPPIVDLAYGYDHACGFFIQIFDDDGEPIVDIDKFDGVTSRMILDLQKRLNYPQIVISN